MPEEEKKNPLFMLLRSPATLGKLLKGIFQALGMKGMMALLSVSLLGLFAAAYVTEFAGNFTINLTADMMSMGFSLSNDAEFKNPTTRIYTSAVEELTNITFSDISPDVNEHYYEHDSDHYLAHTFYIRNSGMQTAGYVYELSLGSQTLDVDQATWIMLFEDGKQMMYTRPSAGGGSEELFGFREPYFKDVCADCESQYYEENGRFGIIPHTYAEGNIIVRGMQDAVEPGETHQYTVVIWVEGNDPDCTDDIIGGHAKFSMNFSLVEEEDRRLNIFNGVYRTDYEDYIESYRND